jgi:SOS-response transcriptional repressor LexA
MHRNFRDRTLGHENGFRGFKLPSAKLYSRRFGVNLTWLLDNSGPMARSSQSARHLSSEDVSAGFDDVRSPDTTTKTAIPLVAWVNAGKLADVDTQLSAKRIKIDLISDLGAGDFFATKVEGDSMNLLSPEGSILIVDRNDRDLVSGRRYIFAIKGKTTFKEYVADDPPYLNPQSSNPKNRPIIIKKKSDVEIVGRVKRTLLDL